MNSEQNSPNTGDPITPEYAIKTQARTFPIFECRINPDWDVVKFANLSVARKHPDGNITVCFYLVDLLCFGVLETEYYYHIPFLEYQDRLNKIRQYMEMKLVPYVLIHNIICAGIAYGERFGFNPANEFTLVSQFNLEKDTDKIEILEIACGDEMGRPIYLKSGFESEEEVLTIIKRLEQTAGDGNFSIVDGFSRDETSEVEEDDDYDDDQDVQ